MLTVSSERMSLGANRRANWVQRYAGPSGQECVNLIIYET